MRLFDGTPVGDWWIFLDMDSASQAGTGENSTEEHAVVLAASLANRGIAEGRAVGLVGEGEQELVWLPPREGIAQMWEILRALAMIKPGGRTLEELLSRLNPRDSAQSSVILVTPNVEGRWLNPLMDLARRGIRPTVLLLDPASYGGKQNAGGISALLTEQEIAGYVFTRDSLDRPELHPGAFAQFKWKTTPARPRDPDRGARSFLEDAAMNEIAGRLYRWSNPRALFKFLLLTVFPDRRGGRDFPADLPFGSLPASGGGRLRIGRRLAHRAPPHSRLGGGICRRRAGHGVSPFPHRPSGSPLGGMVFLHRFRGREDSLREIRISPPISVLHWPNSTASCSAP